MKGTPALLLLFVSSSKAALAFRLQGAAWPWTWPSPRERKREPAPPPPPLLVQRELWAAGVEWTAYPKHMHTGPNYRVWSWTPETEQTFRTWVAKRQFPADCARWQQPDQVAYVRKPHWGLTSRIRDYGDNVIMNMLHHKMTLYHDPHFNTGECFVPDSMILQRTHSQSPWREEEKSLWPDGINSSDPFMNCIFEPLSTCQGKVDIAESRGRALPLKTHYWEVYRFPRFRDLSQSWWEHLKETGLQLQASRHTESERTVALQDTESWVASDSGVVRLGVFRALLSTATFQPNARLQRQIEWLERSLTKPKGPMLVVQVRRTDKYKERGGKPFVTTNGQDLRALRALIHFAEASAGWNYTSFYIISDDPTVFTGERMELLRSAFAARPVALFSPYVQQTYSEDARWMTEGHLTLKDHTANDIMMMADIFYAAKHGSHLVGCGRSGLSQLIAQKLGAKFMMDPNVLSLFEDDRALLTNLFGEVNAISHVAFMNGMFQDVPEDL